LIPPGGMSHPIQKYLLYCLCSAPTVKARSKWTEISYEKIEKESDEATSQGKGKDRGKGKGKKPKKVKESKDKTGKTKAKGKEGKVGKDKKEKKPKRRENGAESGRSEADKERNPTGDALAKKKKALGGAQRKLSIGMERSGGIGSRSKKNSNDQADSAS